MADRRTALGKKSGPLLEAWHRALISRRTFLARLAGVSVAALFPLTGTVATVPGQVTTLTARQRAVLAAVQEHLFPADAVSPGAGDIHALAYLVNVLDDPRKDPDEKAFLVNGTGWLEELVAERLGKSFTELNAEQREAMLRAIEQSRAGENWLATLLLFIFEALLSDPVYGGNPDGIGWRWLEHQPGFPRPPVDRIYGKL